MRITTNAAVSLIFHFVGVVIFCRAHVLNYDSVTVCDGVLKEIQCPNEENIHVLQGFYGKWRNHDCHGESVDPDNLPTCRELRSKTTEIVKENCQGKNSCVLESDKSIYGEPCPDNKAYLYVTFFCMRNGQKLSHHRTMTNEEVVTVPSHGYIIREEKSRLQQQRMEKEKEQAKTNLLLSSEKSLTGSPALNPNPRPIVMRNNGTTALNHGDEEKNLLETTPVEILDFKKINDEKKEKSLPENNPLLFSSKEDALNVENSLRFEKVKEENAERRKLKEIIKSSKTDSISAARPIKTNNESDLILVQQIYNSSSVVANHSLSNTTEGTPNLLSQSRTKLSNSTTADNSTIASPMETYSGSSLGNLISNSTNNATSNFTATKVPENKESQMVVHHLLNSTNSTGAIGSNTNLINSTEIADIIGNITNENKTSQNVSSSHKGIEARKSAMESLVSQLEASPDKTDSATVKSELPKGKVKVKEESDVRSTIICNGESKLIACLPEEGIKIHNAFYGKRTGEDCKGKLPYKDDSPTCSALDARENVEKSCNNKQTCLLFSDENIYGKSLCPHVNKYLSLTYTCVPPIDISSALEKSAHFKPEEQDEDAVSRSVTPRANQNSTVKLCNGRKKIIHCNTQNGIKINAAFYGKHIGTDCRGDLGYRDDIPDCDNPRALDTVKFLCDHQKSCELISESALFGDDVCPGVNKYLDIGYTCR